MRLLLLTCLVLLAQQAPAVGRTCLVTNCADVSRLIRDGTNAPARFSLMCRALSDINEFGKGICLADASGATTLSLGGPLSEDKDFSNGDILRVTGRICTPPGSGRFTRAEAIVRIGRAAPYLPEVLSIGEFAARQDDYRPVCIRGTVRSVLPDEIDRGFSFLVLEADNDIACVALRNESKRPSDRSSARLVGSVVDVTGVRDLHRPANRRQMGQTLLAYRLHTQTPSPPDPFAVPDLSTLDGASPSKVFRSGPCATRGTVLAIRPGNRLLLRRPNGEVSDISLSAGTEAPDVGSSVEIAGKPTTDLYRLNLTHADWRPTLLPYPAEDREPIPVSATDILSEHQNARIFNPAFHGRAVRLTGHLIGRSDIGPNAPCLYLKSDGQIVPVEFGASSPRGMEFPLGSTLEATGICALDINGESPLSSFPQISGFTLVTRRADDIRLLAKPPWWTPQRVWTVFGIFAFSLLGVLVWNGALHTLSERRRQELTRSQLKGLKARLQTAERTRLAVELHDTLSQTLACVSMEIATAESMRGEAPPGMMEHINLAAQLLKSCRGELHSCLWDLRSSTLDETSMEKAIRRALLPLLSTCRLTVRFDVPRARLSDSTAHAILRCIRELAVNAQRHGAATHILITGDCTAQEVRFAVRDNGTGFAPASAPGIHEGHFGLLGIRERIGLLGGRVELVSAPGRGTTVSVRIPCGPRLPEAPSHGKQPLHLGKTRLVRDENGIGR